MIIQMIVQMSGARYDDRMWPVPWTDFEVPDEEGRGLIRCGAAMEVVQPVKAVPPPPAPAPAAKAVPEVLVSAQVPEELPRPSNSDSKEAWVEYAVQRGASRAEAEVQSKANLQAAFGGRL